MDSGTFNFLTYVSIFIGNGIALWHQRNKMKNFQKGQDEIKEQHKDILIRLINRDRKDVIIFGIDDNEDDRKLLERNFLKKLENRYELFSSVSAALKRAPSNKNVYIIDHYMPEMNGINVIEKIKEKGEGNFFIVASDAQSDQVYSDYTKVGIQRFLNKSNKDYKKMMEEAIETGIIECATKNN